MSYFTDKWAEEHRQRELEAQRHRHREERQRWRLDDEEEECECAPDKRDLLDTLREMEKLHSHLNRKLAEFKSMVSDNPELADIWEKFTEMGYTSADDFEKHMNGKVLRWRPNKLRLVASRENKPFVIRRNGNDAA